MAKTATNKQKKAFTALVENGGTIPISEAMRAANYSPETIKTPSKLTTSKGWAFLLGEYADDELILRRIRKALGSEDTRAALQAADMLLKLKDKYPAGKLKIQEYNEELEKLQERQ